MSLLKKSVHYSIEKDRYDSIFKKKIGSMILVPSNNLGITISHKKKAFNVWVAIPPAERKIKVNWQGYREGGHSSYYSPVKEIDIQTPPLLIGTQYYSSYRDKSYIYHTEPSLYEIDTKEKSYVSGRPYIISNVHYKPKEETYLTSKICLGGPDRNPREALNSFFNGTFNTDLPPPGIIPWRHSCCKNTEHNPDYCPKERNRHHKHIAVKNSCDCSQPQLVLEKDYANFCRSCENYFVSDDIKAHIHKLGQVCLCCKNACSCICNCRCCKNDFLCDCKCSCELSQKYFDWIESFENPLPFKDITTHIEGRKSCPGYCAEEPSCYDDSSCFGERNSFLNYPENDVIGVFVSQDVDFMNRIGSKYIWHFKDPDESKGFNAILGFVKEKDKENYEIIFGPEKSYITKKHRVEFL